MGYSGSDVAVDELVSVALIVAAIVLAALLMPSSSAFGLSGPGLDGVGPSLGGDGGLDVNGSSDGTDSPPSTPTTARPTTDQDTPTDRSRTETDRTPEATSTPEQLTPSTDDSIDLSENCTQKNRTPIFRAWSPRPAYWRIRAYRTYTGTGWADPGVFASTDGSTLDLGGPRASASPVRYTVSLQAPRRHLPTMWRPTAIEVVGDSPQLAVAPTGGVQSADQLSAGTQYTARSLVPRSDPAALKAAGRDYPAAIEDRYTQVPDQTPDRVAQFTDELTAETDSPFETALVVRDWLKENKEYSKQTTLEDDRPMADQFIFEADAGFCQHFATTMAVMLRTQGIPARYVTGYASGSKVGENEYQVTRAEAHAWTEVYFPDIGWVRFEPTASGGNSKAEGVHRNFPESADTPDLTPSSTADGATTTPEPTTTDEPTPTVAATPTAEPTPVETTAGGGFEISLNRSVPGAPVIVTVRRDGRPASDVRVLIEDEFVGRTDADGEVVATLPYESNVSVTVETTAPDAALAGPVAGIGGPVAGIGGPVAGLSDPDPSRTAYSATFNTTTTATVAVSGDTVVGGRAVVEATIEGVPVRSATVSIDGRSVGTTSDRGRLAVDLAGFAPGNHTVTVRRGDVAGNATVEIAAATDDRGALAISMEGLPVLLPGTPATVVVTRNGTPVQGATVSVGGDRIGETGANGTVPVTLPLTGTTVVATGPEGARATAGLALVRNAVLVGLLALAVLVAIAVAIGRRADDPTDAATSLAAAIRRLPATLKLAYRRAVVALVRLARGAVDFSNRLLAVTRRLSQDGVGALAALDPRRLLDRWRAWLQSLFASERSTARESPATARATDPADSIERAPRGLRAIWRQFVDLVRPPRPATRTPGEIARRAIDRGFPERPVRRLTDAYRAAEYGGRSIDESRIERLRGALADLRSEGDR
ncbi:MAG: DUF3488 and DUF4129 domain-containing transglutaminase family protein [Halococcoides sp.]